VFCGCTFCLIRNLAYMICQYTKYVNESSRSSIHPQPLDDEAVPRAWQGSGPEKFLDRQQTSSRDEWVSVHFLSPFVLIFSSSFNAHSTRRQTLISQAPQPLPRLVPSLLSVSTVHDLFWLFVWTETSRRSSLCSVSRVLHFTAARIRRCCVE